jgi:hypothetical protein
MDELEFEAGHVFFEVGDPGEAAWVVQEGEVELLSGKARVGLARAGEVFGEMALVDERSREVTARALTAGRVISVPRAAFEGALLKAPLPILECLRALFERLRSAIGSGEPDLGFADEDFLAEGLPEDDPRSPAIVETGSSGAAPAEFPVAQGRAGEWSVVIHPLTRKAAETLPEEGLLVTQFPLRVGRAAAADEKEAMALNDLWLLDEEPFNISRNHCEIYVDGVGPAVRDRGSALGCVVNETSIGGRGKLRSCGLEVGDNVVIVGSRVSPYQFRITVGRR